ncbi:Bromodomain-containing protein, partial [Piromyces finnis]
FHEPVNTSIVTDYAQIIKNPMDFGTMQKKIDTKQYSSISQFQYDFELVIQNAKIYNAPETIYYRTADKISKIGTRLIEKEINTIKNIKEKNQLYYQELRKTKQNKSATNIPEKANSNLDTPKNTLTGTKLENVIILIKILYSIFYDIY